MAVKKKERSGKAPRGGNLIAAILSSTEDLLKTHMSEGIIPLVEEAEDHKATVSMSYKINCAESEPVVEVDIRYTSSVTDRRVTKLDNPDQGTFEPVIAAAEDEAKKRKEKILGNGGEDEEKPATDTPDAPLKENEYAPAQKKRGRPKKEK
jgi:hypothetical protein